LTRSITRPNRLELPVVAALTVLALGLRLALDDQSVGSDELFTYGYTVDQSFSHVLEVDNENNPPLFYLLAWLAAKAGDPTFAIRLPSVLLGAATVPVVYALGARTVGRAAGLVAAAIVAIAPFGLFYGTEARAYSALMFFTALSTLALVGPCRRAAAWPGWCTCWRRPPRSTRTTWARWYSPPSSHGGWSCIGSTRAGC
jgi:4-amino-4-deoxy-L-arabinose transferase-like glycosyltransferase